MKNKVLLTGFHQASVDELFRRTEDSFYCIYSSARELDLKRHIELFQPDLILMCLKNETEKILVPMAEVKKQCEISNIVFMILGNDEECENFRQSAPYVADLAIKKPCTATYIIKTVTDYMEERQRIEMEVLEEDRRRMASYQKEAADEETPAQQEEEQTPQPEPQQEPAPARKHVLVVDDDANMLKLVKRYLGDTYDVATALNGKLAARFLTKKHTDLVLLDYEMPEGSGDVVLAAMRSSEKTKNLPVLFLTGVSDPDKIRKVMAFKPQGYLLKPIDQQKLLDAVRKQIG